ncbi:uncharacterized protein RBU57_015625 [Macrochelys suwanniensis]
MALFAVPESPVPVPQSGTELNGPGGAGVEAVGADAGASVGSISVYTGELTATELNGPLAVPEVTVTVPQSGTELNGPGGAGVEAAGADAGASVGSTSVYTGELTATELNGPLAVPEVTVTVPQSGTELNGPGGAGLAAAGADAAGSINSTSVHTGQRMATEVDGP